MGKQQKIAERNMAYIAGFLDGDGSVIVQVKKRSDTKRGWRMMFTICFYQDTRHEKPLFWIKEKLGIGYISHRNDGMTELRINGYGQTRRVLRELYPYLRFKKKQVKYILEILNLIKERANFFNLTKQERKNVSQLILKARTQTYQSGSKRMSKLKKDLKKISNL